MHSFISPRSVLADLNTFPRSSTLSPSSICKLPSPTSGTIAIGVGLPSNLDITNKENVPPIFDSSLHHPSLSASSLLSDDDDDDDVDVFAAIERLKRAREGEPEDELKEDINTAEQDDADLDFDPFAVNKPPSRSNNRDDDEEQKQSRTSSGIPIGSHTSTSLPAPPLHRTAPSLVRPPSLSRPSPPPPPPVSQSVNVISADIEVGGSNDVLRPSTATKKKANTSTSSSVRPLSTFFASKPPSSSSSSPALSAPYQPVKSSAAVVDTRKRKRDEVESSAPLLSSLQRLPRPHAGDVVEKAVEPVKVDQATSAAFVSSAVAAASESSAVSIASPSHSPLDNSSTSSITSSMEAKGVSGGEVFTADEDDDEERGAESVIDDIEAQLMGDEEDEPTADADPQEQQTVVVGEAQVNQEGEGEGGGEGEGEEGDEDEEDEEDDGNDEEELAAALLEEEASDDEEARLARRNLPSALSAPLSPSHLSTSSSSESDSEHDDWQSLQAEDDRKRKARLDALHANTERLIRSGVQVEEGMRKVRGRDEGRGGGDGVVLSVYEKLLMRVREKEKRMEGEVEVRFIHETEEEERRRLMREGRERLKEEEKKRAIVEKEVDGEQVMEIDIDQLAQEEEEEEEEGDEDDEEEDEAEEQDEGEVMEESVVDPSPQPSSSPAPVESTVTHPLSEVVAKVADEAKAAAVVPSTVPTSEASTDEDADSTPLVAQASPSPCSSDAVALGAEDEELLDDEMDDETTALVRAALERRKKRKLQAEAEEEGRKAKHQRTPPAPPQEVHRDETTMVTFPSPPPTLPTAQPCSLAPSPDDDNPITRRRPVKSSSLVDAEAEDEDVMSGRRPLDSSDADSPALDQYEDDGFITKDTPTPSDHHAIHAALDAVKDREEVEVLKGRLMRSESKEGSRLTMIKRAGTMVRRGSKGSVSSSSPKASPVKGSPMKGLSGVMRSGSGVGLLDDDEDKVSEEEEVDENSAARQHKRALIQHRARMLKHTHSIPSPPTSLSSFIDESSLPPLPSPLHPPTRSTTKPPLPLLRHPSIQRQNSLIGEGGWGKGTQAGHVKGVSLSKSYIFRRVTEEERDKARKEEEGRGKEKTMEKRPLQGAVFLSTIARTQSTVPQVRRKSTSSTLMSAIRPAMLRAVSDK